MTATNLMMIDKKIRSFNCKSSKKAKIIDGREKLILLKNKLKILKYLNFFQPWKIPSNVKKNIVIKQINF